jgi:uncharacterized protein
LKEREEFGQGVALFNARRFFEAHEAWEQLWLRERPPEKAFLQGLIQLAAAFHHLGRGNRRGAESLLAAAIAKLKRFPGNHRGMALSRLRAEAEKWARALRKGTEAGHRKAPRIQMLRAARLEGRKQPLRNDGPNRRTRRRRRRIQSG